MASSVSEASVDPAVTILLVEDFEPNIAVSGALIQELGYNCDIARSGAEALAKIKAGSYTAVIMDIQMPEMDGLEATRRLRRNETENNLPATPVIGMTGNATDDDRMFCLKAGMNDFISKPFRLKELEEKIKKVHTGCIS